MQQNSTLVRGLTEPGEFRDNCGFGLIAHMEGNASHELLQTAIEALTCMTHRGGINADGKPVMAAVCCSRNPILLPQGCGSSIH